MDDGEISYSDNQGMINAILDIDFPEGSYIEVTPFRGTSILGAIEYYKSLAEAMKTLEEDFLEFYQQ